jgi:hypothetical protein
MYNQFIEKWILLALEYLGAQRGLEDTEAFDNEKSFTDIMTEWVEEHWGSEGKGC